MTRPTRRTAVPTTVTPELRAFLETLSDRVGTLDGHSKAPLSRGITIQDLEDLGLVGTVVKRGVARMTLKLDNLTDSASRTADTFDFANLPVIGREEFNDDEHEVIVFDPTAGIGRRFTAEAFALLDDHELITGQWTFADTVTVDIDDGVQWNVDTVRTDQSVPLIITRAINDSSARYPGLQVNSRHTSTGARGGIELSIENITSPTDGDQGNQLGLWEGGLNTGADDIALYPPNAAAAGYRWLHDASDNSEGDLIFYSHDGSTSGTEVYRHRRDDARMYFASGTLAAPTICFEAQPGVGLYVSASHMGFSSRLRSIAGDGSSPTYGWATDNDTGIYLPSIGALGFTTSGGTRLTIGDVDTGGGGDSRGIRSTLSWRAPDGSLAVPAYTFTGDDDTGIYRVGADTLGFATNSTLRLTISTAGVTSTLPFSAPNGASGAVAYGFANDLDTGVFMDTVGELGLAAGGVEGLRIVAGGALKVTSSVGTLGQILKSAGAGAPPFWDSGGGGGGSVDAVFAGGGILVDDSDPANPIVSVDEAYEFTWTALHAFQAGITGSAGDPLFASVIALLHFDGSDTSTTFTDVIGNTWTAAANAQLDTAQFKFGTASMLLDGTNDWAATADDAIWTIEDSDFCLEMWVRFNSTAGEQDFASHYNATSNQRGFLFGWNTTGGVIQFAYSTAGTSGSTTVVSDTWSPTTGVWYHVAVDRNGADLRIFIDGVQQGATHNIGTSSFFNSTAEMRIGARGDGGADFNGWIDDFRFTLASRYTADFTPPTEAFPDVVSGLDILGDMEIGGDLAVVGTIFAPDGSATVPAYTFTSSPDAGMFLLNADIVSMAASGSEVARYRNDASGIGLQGIGYHSYSSMVSPAALSANTNDYNPTGLADASHLRISASSAYDLTGIVTATLIGRVLYLHNIGSSTITLKHDVTSTAANRFLCPNNTDVALRQNGSVRIIYDVTSSRWRVQGP